MRKGFLVLGLLLLAAGLVLTGCPNNNNDDAPQLYVEITLDARGGEFADGWGFRRFEVARGDTIIPPRGVWRDGYAFVEWNANYEGEGYTLTEGTRHNTHARFFAIWRPLDEVDYTVEITFRANGGVFADGLPLRTMTIAKGGTAPPLAVTREGYQLLEWNTSASGLGEALDEEASHYEDTEYWAIWETDLFTETESWDFYPEVEPVAMGAWNAWHLESEIIAAMRDADSGSQLRLHFDATGGAGDDRSNWGIGNIGIPPAPPYPSDIVALTAPAGAGFVYRIYVEVDWLLEILDADPARTSLTVRTHITNGDMLTQIALLVPSAERDSPSRPAAPPPPAAAARAPDPIGGTLVGVIGINTEAGNISIGQGNIDGEDLALIVDTMATADADNRDVVLRVYVRNVGHATATASWGIGQLNNIEVLFGVPLSGDRHNDITQDQLEAILAVDSTEIFVNPYNSHVVTLIELWTVPRAVPMTIHLGDTPVGGILVQGVGGTVTQQESTGFIFAAGSNHRAGYSWFRVDFGDYRLTDFAYIEFDYDVVVAGDVTRRIALIARTAPFVGSLAAHPTPTGHGTTAAACNDTPNDTNPFVGCGVPGCGPGTGGSSVGWLGLGQVTAPILESLPLAEFPGTFKLPIRPDLPIAGAPSFEHINLGAHQVLYLSIYEHSTASTVEISNIRFIPREGCLECDPDPCTCNADITAVRTAIEGLTFTVALASGNNTEAQARAAVESIIVNGVTDMRGVTVAVVPGTFTAASLTSAGNFQFTLDLRKGSGTPQVMGPLNLPIPMAVACAECDQYPCVCQNIVFDLQTYVATLPLNEDIRAPTGNLASTHPSEAVTITVCEGGTPGPRYVHVNRQQANATRGLLLRDVGLQAGDVLFIRGRLLTDGLDMRLQGQSPTFMPSTPDLNREGGAGVGEFTITYTVAGDIVDNDVRILPHNAGIAAEFHVYDITVTRIGD